MTARLFLPLMFDLAAGCQVEFRQIHIGRVIRFRIQEVSSLHAIVSGVVRDKAPSGTQNKHTISGYEQVEV